MAEAPKPNPEVPQPAAEKNKEGVFAKLRTKAKETAGKIKNYVKRGNTDATIRGIAKGELSAHTPASDQGAIVEAKATTPPLEQITPSDVIRAAEALLAEEAKADSNPPSKEPEQNTPPTIAEVAAPAITPEAPVAEVPSPEPVPTPTPSVESTAPAVPAPEVPVQPRSPSSETNYGQPLVSTTETKKQPEPAKENEKLSPEQLQLKKVGEIVALAAEKGIKGEQLQQLIETMASNPEMIDTIHQILKPEETTDTNPSQDTETPTTTPENSNSELTKQLKEAEEKAKAANATDADKKRFTFLSALSALLKAGLLSAAAVGVMLAGGLSAMGNAPKLAAKMDA